MIIINCKICGEKVEKRSNAMKFCKKCRLLNQSSIRKEYYKNNKTKERENNEEWKNNNIGRIKCNWKKWYQKNKIRIKQKRKKEVIMQSRRKHAKDYRNKYPIKIMARRFSKNIPIAEGTLCQKCLKNLAIEKHHEDYNYPEKVLFVCKECHTKITFGGN